MADRREDQRIRTDRPVDAAGAKSLPTVREVLALPAMVAGLPELFCDDAALDAHVRWTHASDSAGVARLLDGGELLLTTGAGWPTDPDALREFVAGLTQIGVAGVVVELGTHYRYLPAVVIDAARQRGLALIGLHREVKFIAITEAVHGRILSEQTAALQARDDVRERFTALALRGAPADFIVQQLAQTLSAPVVLENLAHEVMAAEVPLADEQELFDHWELRSRAAHRHALQRRAAGQPTGSDDWLIVPVEARGAHWGSLIALPGPPHAAGRAAVLEQAAIALALGRISDGGSDEWARIGRRRLVDGLLADRFVSVGGAAARLEAAGLPVDGARLHGLVIAGAPAQMETVDAAAQALRGTALVGSAPGGVPAPAVTILLSLPVASAFDDRAALAFVRTATGDRAERAVLSIGSATRGLEEALVSLQEAVDLAKGGGWGEQVRGGKARQPGPRLRRGEDRPLVQLVTSLRDDHRLLEHGERMLSPLIEHDLTRDGDLLDVLGAMLAHPGNRTAAASASHLSRSVFYQRIALIEDLLGVDLDDGETQTALHIALLVRRSAGR